MIEILADLYGWTLDYCLYRLTFAQALSLLDTRNARDAQAEADRLLAQTPGYVDPSSVSKEPLPLSALTAQFGQVLG